jgi:TM2 domain-containing membrane protein YozV
MLSQAKDRKIAAALALAGIVLPGLHKFYLRQPRWGIIYLLLCWTPISRIASAAEAVWYLFHDREEFDRKFNSELNPERVDASNTVKTVRLEPIQVSAVAEAVRQLEQLRQDGLVSEYEFEQKRRQLLDRIG